MFRLDTKTQRGFMACLTPEMLEVVMGEETILLEIKLATLQHYIETVRYIREVGCTHYYHGDFNILFNCFH